MPSTPSTWATWAVKATRRGGDVRRSPSRRATTECRPSAPTTTRALHVTRSTLPDRTTTHASAEPFENGGRRRAQVLRAGFVTREAGAVEQQDRCTRPGEQQCCGRACGASADDDDVPGIIVHAASVVFQDSAERRQGRADQCGRQIHPIVVEPAPAPGESYRLVAHATPALEPRVARRALVLRLDRRAEQRVTQHSGDACGRDEGG